MNLGEDVEAKVRQLLARTELKEIAETARVLVEISDNTQSTLGNIGSTLNEDVQSKKTEMKKISSLMTTKMNLSPRE